jgi:sec-independent protein translocase protein TatA
MPNREGEALFNLGPMEMLVILLIALLLFGSRLPSAMRSLGKSVSEFKKGLREGEDELRAAEKGEKAAREGPSGGQSSRPAG